MARGPDAAASRRALVAATTTATLAILPVFLVGATAPAIRLDLGFTTAGLGAPVAAFWVAMALAGAPGGRLVQAWGATGAIRVGAAAAAVALLGAATAGSLFVLCGWLALGGLASGLCQPASDLAVAQGVPDAAQGRAFGIKQGSVPGATLLAGLAVPALALTVGWRWAFVAAAGLAIPAVLTVPDLDPAGATVTTRATAGSATTPTAGSRPTGVWPLAAAVALAMASVSAMGAFYVESAVAAGTGVAAAGLLLAVGSAFGVAGRFVFASRLAGVARPFHVTALLTGIGGLATLVLGLGVTGPALVAATVPAFAAGWGWNGLFTYAVVRANPGQAARASGIIVVGAAAGGVAGPLAFSVVVSTAGFGPAWEAAGVAFLAATALMVLAAPTIRPATP